MRLAFLSLVSVLVFAGCSKDHAKDHAGDDKPVTRPRPSSVSVETVKMVDAYRDGLVKLSADLAAAGTDCKRATAAVIASTQAEGVIDADRIQAALADPQTRGWFDVNYGPAISAAMDKARATVEACRGDAEFSTAMAANTLVPRKKKRP